MSTYQQRRADAYKRFSGAIVMYQATANSLCIKPYLQYFMVDSAIIPALRVIYEKSVGKKLQLCSAVELSIDVIHGFIDSVPTAELIHQYQLVHGPEGSKEFQAAGERFLKLSRCTFNIELAAAAKNIVNNIGKHEDLIPQPATSELQFSKSLRHASAWPQDKQIRELPPLLPFSEWKQQSSQENVCDSQPMLYECILGGKNRLNEEEVEAPQRIGSHTDVNSDGEKLFTMSVFDEDPKQRFLEENINITNEQQKQEKNERVEMHTPQDEDFCNKIEISPCPLVICSTDTGVGCTPSNDENADRSIGIKQLVSYMNKTSLQNDDNTCIRMLESNKVSSMHVILGLKRILSGLKTIETFIKQQMRQYKYRRR